MKQSVYILGSCVTRDAFEYDFAKNYDVKGYLARSSIASAFYPIKYSKNIDLTQIASPFQRRMVEHDLFKKAKDALLKENFDWIIIDLIDERFNLYYMSDNSLITLSPELENNIDMPPDGRIISKNTDEFFKYWCEGWDSFIYFMKVHGLLHKIIVNKVYWTNTLTNGELVVDKKYQHWIDENNDWLDRLYNYILTRGPVHILEYNSNMIKADSSHKWGKQPYHYSRELYFECIRQLNVLAFQSSNRIHITDCDMLVPQLACENINKTFVLEGSQDQLTTIVFDLKLASGSLVGARELLFSILMSSPLSNDEFLELGYALSPDPNIGFFKYIPTKENQIYNSQFTICIPKGVEFAVVEVKSFFPKGSTTILEARAQKIN